MSFKGEINIMNNEYKIYFSMKNYIVPQTTEDEVAQKKIEYQFIKTSALHLNLDLPEKYKNNNDLIGAN
jgi:hypothetical protein